MTISYITGLSANQQSAGTTNTATTGQPLDTTGANLIVVSVPYFDYANIGAVTVTDSKGNTYTALNNYGGSGADHQQRVFYCLAPIVGTNHTFIGGSASSISSLSVVAFSGVATSSPVDQQNGFYQASGSTIQAGSITPTQNNELIISALEHRIESGLATIDSGFTLVDQRLWDSGGLGTAIAYKIQTTASDVNPTWTLPASVKAIAASVSFKADGAGGGSTNVTIANSQQVNTASQAAIYQAVPTGTLTIPAVKDWGTGLLKTGQTGVTVDVHNIATGALVVRKTGQTTHGTTGVCVVTDALIAPGTTYEVCTRFADGSKGMWDYTAS